MINTTKQPSQPSPSNEKQEMQPELQEELQEMDEAQLAAVWAGLGGAGVKLSAGEFGLKLTAVLFPAL